MKLSDILNEAKISNLKRKTSFETKQRSKGVRNKLVRKDKKNHRWAFDCSSDGDHYKVTIQSEGEGKLRDLDAKISCTCPAFLYWGSDYWATKYNYLDKHDPGYRSSKSKGKPPEVRDPFRKHSLCKHVVAIYDEWKDVNFP